VAQQPKSGLERLVVVVSRSHTISHTHPTTPLKEWSARRRDRYPHNTKQTQETNIHVIRGIRTQIPAIMRLQTYASDRTALGISTSCMLRRLPVDMTFFDCRWWWCKTSKSD